MTGSRSIHRDRQTLQVAVALLVTLILIPASTASVVSGDTQTGAAGPDVVEELQAQNNATVNATQTSGGLELTSTAFEDGTTYIVNVTTSVGGDQVVYVRSITASGSSISIEQPALSTADQIVLTVMNDTNVVYNSVRLPVKGNPPLEGAVGSSNITVFETLPGAVSRVWMDSSGSVTTYTDVQKRVTNRSHTVLEFNRTVPEQTSTAVLEFENTNESVRVVLEESRPQENLTATGSTNDSAATGQGGTLFGISGNPLKLVGVVLAGIAITALFGGFVVRNWYGVLSGLLSSEQGTSGDTGSSPARSSSAAGATGAESGAQRIPVSFTLTDSLTGDRYPGQPTVVAWSENSNRRPPEAGPGARGGRAGRGQQSRPDGSTSNINSKTNRGRSLREPAQDTMDPVQKRATDGEVSLDLWPGTWEVEVIDNGETLRRSREQVREADDLTWTIEIEPYVYQVSLQDGARNQQPLSGATVTVDPDVGHQRSQETDSKGQAQLEVSRAATQATVTLERERYETESQQLDLSQGNRRLSTTETLRPATGELDLQVTLNDTGVQAALMRVTPVDDWTRRLTDEREETTKSDGTVHISDLPVGSYEVGAAPQLEGVTTAVDDRTVVVQSDETTTVDMVVTVDYSLSREHKERLRSLRDRVNDLGAATNRDTAIPDYYGSVIGSTLDAVEKVGRRPELVAAQEQSPDAVVDALLQAAEDGLSAVEGAMNTTRNVKLFRACDSMSDVDERWSGSVDLQEFLDRVENEADQERRALRDRLRDVDEFLDGQWNEVGELGPVRETFEQVQMLTQSGEKQSDLAEIARVYMALCLLDAIETLFEREPLLARLNKTVY
jgi:hypothetical protein